MINLKKNEKMQTYYEIWSLLKKVKVA